MSDQPTIDSRFVGAPHPGAGRRELPPAEAYERALECGDGSVAERRCAIVGGAWQLSLAAGIAALAVGVGAAMRSLELAAPSPRSRSPTSYA